MFVKYCFSLGKLEELEMSEKNKLLRKLAGLGRNYLTRI
jgi:hypothetical protein